MWRKKLRSAIVIIAVTLGIFGGTLSMAIMKSMTDNRVKSAIEIEIAHIQFHNDLFLDNNELQYTIDETQEIVRKIIELPEVKAVSKRTKIMAMASTSATGTGIIVNGIFPDMEKEVSKLYEYICDSCGTYFDSPRKNSIVIGKKLADKLKVKMRSKIVITFQSDDGTIIGGAFRVVGIFKTDNNMWDELNVFVKNQDLVNLAGFEEEKIHEISVLMNDIEDAEPVTEKLKNAFPELNIKHWKEIRPDLGMMNDMMDQLVYIFLFIILLALGFGIVNTMLMVIMERVRELGMLMAIGMNKLKIFTMIMLETIFLSLTGGVIGMIVGMLFIGYFGKAGMDFSVVAEGLGAYGFGAIFYPRLSFDYYITLTIMVILAGIIASVYPALKAMKLNPAESIRTI